MREREAQVLVYGAELATEYRVHDSGAELRVRLQVAPAGHGEVVRHAEVAGVAHGVRDGVGRDVRRAASDGGDHGYLRLGDPLRHLLIARRLEVHGGLRRGRGLVELRAVGYRLHAVGVVARDGDCAARRLRLLAREAEHRAESVKLGAAVGIDRPQGGRCVLVNHEARELRCHGGDDLARRGAERRAQRGVYRRELVYDAGLELRLRLCCHAFSLERLRDGDLRGRRRAHDDEDVHVRAGRADRYAVEGGNYVVVRPDL